MKIGFIGLGKMGYFMVRKLLTEGHEVVVYNRSPEPVEDISKRYGAIPSSSFKDLVDKLPSPAVIWMMIPHRVVEDMISRLIPFMKKGDLLVDGGNSNYKDTMRRAQELARSGIHYLDVGVSGGLAAAESGYCMMAGGEKEQFKRIEPAVRDMCVPGGYGHFGPSGAGHYVKMVHNAIEYGMMQAIGEGLDLVRNGPFSKTDQVKLTDVWNHGSIISSFLVQMTHQGLKRHPDFSDVDGYIPHSGEGQWALEDAAEHGVDMPVIEQSFKVRLNSDKIKTYATKAVAVMRDEFGGHGVRKK